MVRTYFLGLNSISTMVKRKADVVWNCNMQHWTYAIATMITQLVSIPVVLIATWRVLVQLWTVRGQPSTAAIHTPPDLTPRCRIFQKKNFQRSEIDSIPPLKSSTTPHTMAIKRVAIIGAGPAGAIAVDAFHKEQAFDVIRVFERREKAGGCW